MDKNQLIDSEDLKHVNDARVVYTANGDPSARVIAEDTTGVNGPFSALRSATSGLKLLSLNRAKGNSIKNTSGESPASLKPSEQRQVTCTDGEENRAYAEAELEGNIMSMNGSSNSHNTDWQTHCHLPTQQDGTSNDARQKSANRRLLITTILCAFFMILELVGGYVANSLSIMTDAAHLFSDIASFALSLLAVHLSAQKSNRRYTFGYQRAEILGAVCSILLIWALTAVVVYLAIQRLITMDFEIESGVMMVVSLFGVGVNILMGITLHGCMCTGNSEAAADASADAELGKPNGGGDKCSKSNGHNHSHSKGHSHSHKHDHGHSHGHSHGMMEGESINIRAAFIHVLGDLIQSVGVFVAALLIHFRPEWKIADPICTFVFSIIVLFTTIRLMRESLLVLMEGAPPQLNYMTIKHDLLSMSGVQMVHALRLWQLSVDHSQMSCHLVISGQALPEQVLHSVRHMLRTKHSIEQATIQIETYQPQVMLVCEQCNDF